MVILVTSGFDHTIRFWDAPSGSCVRSLQYTASQVNSLAIQPSKQYLAAAGFGSIALYEIQSTNHQPVASLDGHTGNITAIEFEKSTGKWLCSAGEDATLKLWDMRSASPYRTFKASATSPINCLALHPNQVEIVVGQQNGTISIYDLAADRCRSEVSITPDNSVGVQSVSLSADGRQCAAASKNGIVKLWRIGGGSEDEWNLIDKDLHPIQAHQTYILSCSLSPDGRTLATCSADHSVRLWNTDTFECQRELRGHGKWVWDCAFSADSAYLITASSDQTARLWDLNTGETVRTYQGHTKAVVAVALNDK